MWVQGLSCMRKIVVVVVDGDGIAICIQYIRKWVCQAYDDNRAHTHTQVYSGCMDHTSVAIQYTYLFTKSLLLTYKTETKTIITQQQLPLRQHNVHLLGRTKLFSSLPTVLPFKSLCCHELLSLCVWEHLSFSLSTWVLQTTVTRNWNEYEYESSS